MKQHGDTCGCCVGLQTRTPMEVTNAPGLSAIAYRIGTWASFRESLLAQFGHTRTETRDPLDPRSEQSFAAALADAWAVAGDILTFYQERIANESYLRTATERQSVLQLARMTGYELRPGVAADAWLAFTIDSPPAPPPAGPTTVASVPLPVRRDAMLERGLKVQSVPGPNEKPQTFETVETITAWPEWNALLPRVRRPQQLSVSSANVDIEGESDIRRGEFLLLTFGPWGFPRRVDDVQFDPKLRITRLHLADPAPGITIVNISSYENLALTRLAREKSAMTATVIENEILVKISGGSTVPRAWRAEDLGVIAEFQGWNVDEFEKMLHQFAGRDPNPAGSNLNRLRTRASIFGYNAPRKDTLPADLQSHVDDVDATKLSDEAGTTGTFIDLDTLYPEIPSPSWAILRHISDQNVEMVTLYDVTGIAEVTRAKFLLTGRVTRLTLDKNLNFASMFIRRTSVFTTPVPLPIATEPFDPSVPDPQSNAPRKGLVLDGVFIRLRPGRRVVVTGKCADLFGQTGTEQRTLTEVRIETGLTTIYFDTPLVHEYDWTTVTVNANVARATHGETTKETLGSGNAATPYQRFTLKQKPLTYTGAKNPRGSESSLHVFVNDVEWHEVDTLYERGPHERIFITRRADDGTTTVQFGDGINGARVPTGVENVRAEYRKAIGLEGLVRADQLTLLLSQPLNLKAATNPLPAATAADPEPRDEARRNAPLQVMTLDRAVSLRDFEDFARAYAGVAKALATRISGRERPGVFVTVAGPNGAPFDRLADLAGSLRQSGDPFVPIIVKSYQSLSFSVETHAKFDPDHLPDVVKKAIEDALRKRYSFDAQSFGQPVFHSEAVAVVQGAEGVVSATVTLRDRDGNIVDRIPAQVPQGDNVDESTDGAQLLTLDPRPLQIILTVSA